MPPHDAEEKPEVIIRDKRRLQRDPDPQAQPTPGPVEWTVPAETSPAPTSEAGAEDMEPESQERPSPGGAALQRMVADLQRKVNELTSDLQRITAEYANYRKRVERDRAAVVDVATASVITSLLPVLDNLDLAREHGDLTGAFKAVADQLAEAVKQLGLEPFGEAGDEFDPNVHEAAAHHVSADVTKPTCVTVMRRGYKHGGRLIRAALVAVAEAATSEHGELATEADMVDETTPSQPKHQAQSSADNIPAEGFETGFSAS